VIVRSSKFRVFKGQGDKVANEEERLICFEMCLIGVILILLIFFLKKKKIIIEFVKLTYSTMIDLIMNLNISYKKNEKNKIKPTMERFPCGILIDAQMCPVLILVLFQLSTFLVAGFDFLQFDLIFYYYYFLKFFLSIIYYQVFCTNPTPTTWDQDPFQLLSIGEELVIYTQWQNSNFTLCEIIIMPLIHKERLLSNCFNWRES
jgi:hypothetical protein